MKFLRWKASNRAEIAEDSSISWHTRINPFKRPSSRVAKPVEATPPPTAFTSNQDRMSLSSTLSRVSEEAVSPISDFSSRRSSMISSVGFGQTSDPSSTNPLQRQNSIYSHRSLSIRRDRAVPPSAIHPAFRNDPFSSQSIDENDCLVLTSTSKYPTGIAAELYVPEDCSYEAVMRRNKERRKSELRDQLTRNAQLIRKNSGIKTSEEKQRMKRMSVNF